MFQVGEKVVYPTHGVGKVESIEEREVSGLRQSYYVLKILGNGMRVMVPTQNADRVGLRGIIAKQDVPKVMAILKKNDVEICSNWNRRFKDNLERIKTGPSSRSPWCCGNWWSCRRSGVCPSAKRRCWKTCPSSW
jgi:CarD family transcriptional regulator